MDPLIEQLARQIIQVLKLEDLVPDAIDPAVPLFGAGLGLDSIDGLELIVMLEKEYQIQITDIEVGRKAFASLNALAAFIRERQRCAKTQ
jgi:acyl carrier protein